MWTLMRWEDWWYNWFSLYEGCVNKHQGSEPSSPLRGHYHQSKYAPLSLFLGTNVSPVKDVCISINFNTQSTVYCVKHYTKFIIKNTWFIMDLYHRNISPPLHQSCYYCHFFAAAVQTVSDWSCDANYRCEVCWCIEKWILSPLSLLLVWQVWRRLLHWQKQRRGHYVWGQLKILNCCLSNWGLVSLVIHSMDSCYTSFSHH